jgi:hypothetical protein
MSSNTNSASNKAVNANLTCCQATVTSIESKRVLPRGTDENSPRPTRASGRCTLEGVPGEPRIVLGERKSNPLKIGERTPQPRGTQSRVVSTTNSPKLKLQPRLSTTGSPLVPPRSVSPPWGTPRRTQSSTHVLPQSSSRFVWPPPSDSRQGGAKAPFN